MSGILESIHGHEDLQRLEIRDLPQLAEEVRYFIKTVTNVTGGHIGSGMGVVELTIALHYLFDFKNSDHLVMDVGHQCYPHKILTGRREEMITIRQRDGLSGFPDPKESPYDRVKTGHGGTSLSTAMGLALGLKHAGLDEGRKVVAMIGDAGLQEGMALEALNFGGTFEELPLIIVLNDNEHGIGPAVGALRKYFSMARAGEPYLTAKDNFKRMVKAMEKHAPLLGRLTYDVADLLKSGVTHMLPTVYPGAIFESLGYLYYGPIDGHDIDTVLDALNSCRQLKRPIVLHAITQKGKGYSYKADRLGYHAGSPAKTLTSHLPKEHSRQGKLAYTDIFVDEAMQMAEEDPRIVAITAAMLEGTGLVRFQEKFPNRCYDVGMAEQHAVGLAQGLALAGQRPICSVYSTFMQRSVDQIFQEIALIKTPVMLCMDRAGLVGPDGATHNGVFDIAFSRMFPDMVVMAPRDGSELRAMMRLASQFAGPTAIRYPRTQAPALEQELPATPLELGKAETLREGGDGCLLAYGAMVYIALDVAEAVARHSGQQLAVINARFAKPLDRTMIAELLDTQPFVLTLEDHVRAGGFGAAVLEEANLLKLNTAKIEIAAIEDRWSDHSQRIESLAAEGLDAPSLTKRILEQLLVKAPSLKASVKAAADAST